MNDQVKLYVSMVGMTTKKKKKNIIHYTARKKNTVIETLFCKETTRGTAP